MKSMFVKGGIALALAAAFGVNAPVVDAASIVPVQPTVAVVDANHAAIVGANTLLNAFNNIQKQRLQKLHLMAKMVKLNMKLKALIQQVSMS